MLICHCERVNDRRIREAIENGARTVGQVGRICGAGTCCGGCVKAIAELVEEGDALADLDQGGRVDRIPSQSFPSKQGPSVRRPAERRPLPIAAE